MLTTERINGLRACLPKVAVGDTVKFDPPLPPLKLRHLWRWLHRWMGLLAGLAFVLLGLTGSLLAFRDEIDALLAAEFHRTSAQGARKSFEKLVALAIGAIQLSGRTPMKLFFILQPLLNLKHPLNLKGANAMKRLTLLILATMLWARPIGAAEHQVQMKNQGADGAMVFEPGYLKVEKGDMVKFIAADKLHNSQSLLVPEGAAAWNGTVDEEITVTLDQEGVYIYQCLPHSVLGMVGIIQVGQPVNLEQAKARAKELSTSMVAGKDRLDRYLGRIK